MMPQTAPLISKKPFPLEMSDAELMVESWWQEQIRRLPVDTATSILMQCRTASAHFSKEWIQLDLCGKRRRAWETFT
jgi:hypothetical protein